MRYYLWHHLRNRLGVGLVLLLLTSASHSTEGTAPKVLVLGDSLSAAYGMNIEQGWVHLLAQKLKARASQSTVVNASISGDTTGGGARRLPALLKEHEPTLVIIELGGNDGLRAYPIKQMRTHLTEMTRASKNANAKVLLLAAEAPPNLGRRYTTMFRDSYAQVAQQDDVAVLPFIVEHIFLSEQLMQRDGTHPNAEAQPLLLDVVWPTLIALLGDSSNE
jgi:acyl-CoA thioesterase-1